ncbi:hypothetical protein [Rubritalea tangerina]
MNRIWQGLETSWTHRTTEGSKGGVGGKVPHYTAWLLVRTGV